MNVLFRKIRWGLFDCESGHWLTIDRVPFEIGSGPAADLRLNGHCVDDRHCLLQAGRGRSLCLVPPVNGGRLLLDGLPVSEALELEPDREYSLQVGNHPLLLRGSRDLDAWRAGLGAEEWSIQDPAAETAQDGVWTWSELRDLAQEHRVSPTALALPKGARRGFTVEQIFGELTSAAEASDAVDSRGHAGAEVGFVTESEWVDCTAGPTKLCPVCWHRFRVGELMHVAVHDALRGDPLLGPEAPKRFLATRFNEFGQALDDRGEVCEEMACPRCRWILPPGFLESDHHILSIVGDQSAGKSYFLSVLVQMLPRSLYRNFATNFDNANPTGNALLNEMKKTLFSAKTPEEAHLIKTQLDGEMYLTLSLFGREKVSMPRPFVYSIKSTVDAERRCSVIFYDNAGEHYQAGRDSADSPGARHVASSSGLLYLFDPFNHPGFRRRMEPASDPQLEKPVQDQQDILLSEMKVRLKKLSNIPLHAKVVTPLAVMVGKCDAWQHWLGEEQLRQPVVAGRLDLEAVRYNSDLVRTLMLEIAETVVANAEEISSHVMYFPVSSFGHAPVKIGDGAYAPDPKRLNPFLVEVPALWVLSRIHPGLIQAS